MRGKPSEGEVLPVPRTRDEARRFYDRLSGVYDLIAGGSEARHSERALGLLSIEDGERALEIGPGTGRCLQSIAVASEWGALHVGLDISAGMLSAARRRLDRAGLGDRVELCCGDALHIPFREGLFDSAFMSFTLELFDTPDIPVVLENVWMALRAGGRLGVAGLSRGGDPSLSLRLYEWAHVRWPRFFDCRPIHVEASLREAGFPTLKTEMASMFGLPVEMVVSERAPTRTSLG